MNQVNLRLTWTLSALLLISSVASVGAYEIEAFTEPFQDIEVAASEMGTISEIRIKEGDRVQAGQILAELNQQALKASLKVAKANMTAEGRLNSARAEFQMHIDRLAKMTGLRERKHASQREVELTKTQHRIAEAKLQAVVDELQVKAGEYERIKAQLEQRRIRTPIDGIVTHVYKDQGEFVSATDPVVVRVVQLDPLRVTFSVPTSDALAIKKSQLVRVAIGYKKDHLASGVVEFVSPTIEAQSGTRRVKVRLPNPEGELQSGKPCVLLLNGPGVAANGKGKKKRLGKMKTLTVGTVE